MREAQSLYLRVFTQSTHKLVGGADYRWARLEDNRGVRNNNAFTSTRLSRTTGHTISFGNTGRRPPNRLIWQGALIPAVMFPLTKIPLQGKGGPLCIEKRLNCALRHLSRKDWSYRRSSSTLTPGTIERVRIVWCDKSVFNRRYTFIFRKHPRISQPILLPTNQWRTIMGVVH